MKKNFQSKYINIFQEKQKFAPVKLKLLLNMKNDSRPNHINPSLSYLAIPKSTSTSHNNRYKSNIIKNISFISKTPKKYSCSKTYRNNKSQNKIYKNSIYNFIIKNSKLRKKHKSIKAKELDIFNILINRSSKDILVNMISMKDKNKKNLSNIQINNYIDLKYFNTDNQRKSFENEKIDNTRYETNLLTSSDNKINIKSKEIFNKLEDIKIKANNLMEKYQFLIENLSIQLKIEKNKYNNNENKKINN